MKAKTKNKKHLKSMVKYVRHVVKLAVVPHKKNDYRPHLIRKYGLAVVIFLVISVQFGYNLATVGKILGVQSDVSIASLLEQTNQTRADNGVGELKLNEKLNSAAALKAQDMLTNQYWAHTSPDGVEPWKWFGDVEYDYSEAGENLAKGFYSTSAVMTAWMNSPDHKDNIINPNYKDVGFAVISGELDGKTTSLIVALYGEEARSLVADIQSAFSEAETNREVNFLAQFAVALQSITPAAIISLALIMLTIVVAAFAHAHHDKISKSINHSWKRHHGLYKALGMSAFGMVVIWVYSGGQI